MVLSFDNLGTYVSDALLEMARDGELLFHVLVRCAAHWVTG